jgi:hypothetical protein
MVPYQGDVISNKIKKLIKNFVTLSANFALANRQSQTLQIAEVNGYGL